MEYEEQKAPFEITNTIINYVVEIAELVGQLTSSKQLSTNPTLRRANRIRTIHGSLAIEQNTLSLEQVTAVLNGKQVLAPPRTLPKSKMPMRFMSGWMNLIHTRWTIC